MNYNKLKRSAEKITMPEETEKKIIARCRKTAEGSIKESTAVSGFSQQVSGVEKVRPRRIARIAGAAAACAVAVGGLGVTFHLINRSSAGNSELAGETEMSEITEIDSSGIPGGDTSQKTAPFGDLRGHDFKIVSHSLVSDTVMYPVVTELSEEQKTELAVFFNNADYPEWTEEDEAEAALSSYPALEKYRLICCEDPQFRIVEFDVTGCLTYTHGSYHTNEWDQVCSDDYVTEKYRIDYNSFSKAVERFTDINLKKENVDVLSSICFEKCINDGAAVKYTLSDSPRPDLTQEQCRLLDEYLVAACKKEKIAYVQGHVNFNAPVMKFEVTDFPYSLYIYSDNYIYLKDETGLLSAWYKYSGYNMYSEIETIFRNGSTDDVSAFYPPFGNLAKISDGTYDVNYSRDGISGTLPIDGETLHQALYGYDWAACETNEPETISDKVISFGFDHDGSQHTMVNLYDNGTVSWTVTDRTTGTAYEERWYQLGDTKAFELIAYPFSTSCINRQSDTE